MRLYVVTGSTAAGYPLVAPPLVTSDRDLAAKTWQDWALEGVTREATLITIETIKALAVDFANDENEQSLEWVVNNEGPVKEMVTYQVHTVQAPNLRHIVEPRR